MDDDTSGERPPQRRVVRRVVRRTVVAPPPPTVSRVRPARSEVSPTPSPTRQPAADRPSRPGGRRRERTPWRERLTSLLPARDEPEAVPEPEPVRETEPEPVAGEARTQDEPVADEPARDEPVADETPTVRLPLRTRLAGPAATVRGHATDLLDRATALPRLAYAALVGLVLGVGCVVVCWLAVLVFAATLGTPAGGRWGFGVLLVVGVAAAVAGSRLLDAADVPEPGATSVIAVLLVPVVVLALFLGLSTTGWAVVLVPLLGAATFAAVQPLTERLATRPRDTAT